MVGYHNPLRLHSRQATLPARSLTRKAGSYLQAQHQWVWRHTYRPPRLQGHRPHAFVDRPTAFTPSQDPGLGASSQD